jgi:dihydrofolate reductase
MGRVIASEFVTLDGVIEAPGHEEHRVGRNAWALRGTSEDQQRFKTEELSSADALLLGRVTYQIFAAFWPTAPGDEAFANRMNGLRKYVVSTTLKRAEWNNSVILSGDIAEQVSKVKQRHGGDILIHGSADLVNSLMKHDLIDEYRLLVFPVVLGSGKRLFRDESDTSHLRLVGTRAFSSGVVLLSYQPSGEGPSSEYAETFAWTEEQIKSPHRTQIACWPRSCSRTSWIPPDELLLWAIDVGVRSWIVMTRSRGRRSSASAATS